MKAKSRETLEGLILNICSLKLIIDDVSYMKSITTEERHKFCNQMMELQNDYHKRTGEFYIPPQSI